MNYPLSTKFYRTLLIIVLLINALSAVAGGYGLIFMNGLGMPTEWLWGSPFSSYVGPGLILFFIIGGTNLLALINLIKNKSNAPEYSAVAGFGLLIWIYSEIYIVKNVSFLQTVYFASGILVLILTGIMLRITTSKDKNS